jgi:hypothetical protein
MSMLVKRQASDLHWDGPSGHAEARSADETGGAQRPHRKGFDRPRPCPAILDPTRRASGFDLAHGARPEMNDRYPYRPPGDNRAFGTICHTGRSPTQPQLTRRLRRLWAGHLCYSAICRKPPRLRPFAAAVQDGRRERDAAHLATTARGSTDHNKKRPELGFGAFA